MKPTDVATLIVFVVLLTATLVMVLPRSAGGHLGSTFTAEHVAMFGMVDNAMARLAHRVALLLLAVLSVVAVLWAARHAPRRTLMVRVISTAAPVVRVGAALAAVITAAVMLVLGSRQHLFGPFEGRIARLGFYLLSAGVLLAVASGAGRLRSGAFRVATWVGVLAYALFLTLPGFRHPVYANEPLLASAEWHYSVTVAQGDRLAAGEQLGEKVRLDYGLIAPLALGALQRRLGLLSFGEHVRLVQLSQVLFLVVALAAFFLWRPRDPVFLLFAALLVGPWVSTSHLAVFHPNLAGWRFGGLAAGILLLLLACRLTVQRAAPVLGAGTAVLVLFNPETGACLLAGYAVYLLSRLRPFRPGAAATVIARFATAGLAAVLAVLVTYRLALGAWPPAASVVQLGFVTSFAKGYASLPLYFHPLAVVIFSLGAYHVARGALRWHRGLHARESVALAIAVTTLVWFAYFVNRPHPWNIWTFTFLFAFLAADFFTPRHLRRLRQLGRRAAADPGAAAMGFIVLPLLLFNNLMIVKTTSWAATPPPGPLTSISGLWVPRATGDGLRAKAAFVARQDSASTLYLTRYAYSIPLLAGRFAPLRVQNAFAETTTNEEFELLVRDIRMLAPRCILFDPPALERAPGTGLASPVFYDSFYDRIKSRLAAEYRPVDLESGWEIWERQGTGDPPCSGRS